MTAPVWGALVFGCLGLVAGLLGMLTGWFGWPQAVLAFFAALVVGLVHGSVVALATRGGRGTAFAFGPAMVVGAASVVLLVGPAVL